MNKRFRSLYAIAFGTVLLALLIGRLAALNPILSDREFDDGSRIETQALSLVQVENLSLLGKVWGFAKYHHPRVATGRVHWDYELFRIMPGMLEAETGEAASRRLAHWLKSFGELKSSAECAPLPENLHLSPDIEWIHDATSLGPELSALLALVHESRP